MRAHSFLQKLNWKHILIHLLAIYFIRQSGFHFSFLTDTELIELIKNGNEGSIAISEESLTARRIQLLTAVGLLTGGFMIAGFLLSLFLSIKRKWYWLNALIAFALLLLISKLMPVASLALSELVVWVSPLINSIFWTNLLSGLLFLVCGLALLFLPPLHRFIQGNNKKELETFQFEKPTAMADE